jgi:hypothetical protein
MAAGPLISAGTPTAWSPVSSDQMAQTTALIKTIQYVAAEMPSRRSARNTRRACGTDSRQESAAPNHASISTKKGHLPIDVDATVVTFLGASQRLPSLPSCQLDVTPGSGGCPSGWPAAAKSSAASRERRRAAGSSPSARYRIP